MSDVPFRSDLDRMVDRYLGELAAALQRLPVSQRDHLLNEIREHISELRAAQPARDAWDMEALLNRVGLPEDIAAAALENVDDNAEDAVNPAPIPVPAPVVSTLPTTTTTPTPTPTSTPSWSRRSRLLAVFVAAIVLVVAVSVVVTRHSDDVGPGGSPSNVVPTTTPFRPSTPSRATVPVVIGQTLAQATVAIQSTGLAVGSVSDPSNAVPAGEVLSQSPAGGSFVPPASVVTLVVSSGPAS